jgi:hypothetical protein
MKDEYTFVTLDNDMVTMGDAVFVDIDDTVNTEMDFVQIDDSFDVDFPGDGLIDDGSDFITMDDMGIINDDDIDTYSSDINEAEMLIIL